MIHSWQEIIWQGIIKQHELCHIYIQINADKGSLYKRYFFCVCSTIKQSCQCPSQWLSKLIYTFVLLTSRSSTPHRCHRSTQHLPLLRVTSLYVDAMTLSDIEEGNSLIDRLICLSCVVPRVWHQRLSGCKPPGKTSDGCFIQLHRITQNWWINKI